MSDPYHIQVTVAVVKRSATRQRIVAESGSMVEVPSALKVQEAAEAAFHKVINSDRLRKEMIQRMKRPNRIPKIVSAAALFVAAFASPFAHSQVTTNFVGIPIRLAFDFTNDASNVDGFLLYQSTTLATPVDQWVPVLGIPASAYSLPGTNFALPAFTNFASVVKSNGRPVSVTQYYFSLASTNNDLGTNAVSFSNTVNTKGAPANGALYKR